MTKVDVINMKGEVIDSLELNDDVFGIKPNHDVMRRAVLNHLANRRQGTAKTKGRSEVRGGGRKPWRQKGTGRARHGSSRSPIWVGGGVVFGPKPRCYRYTLPRKMKRLAMKSALSAKVADGNLIVLDELNLPEIKTKKMVEVLQKIGVEKGLVISEHTNKHVILSSRNIPGIKTAEVQAMNVFDILKFDKLVLTRDVVARLEEVYAK